MNNLFVYCEIEDGAVLDVSLELLTKGKSLAAQLGCKLEAVAIGHNLACIVVALFGAYCRLYGSRDRFARRPKGR